MKKVCQELIDFFENEEGWDKDELLTDYVYDILKKAGSELLHADELTINDDEKDVMVLSDFVDALFAKIIEGVCNVIKTA